MSQTTNVKQVKMNIMTQQQYTQATKNPNELYMVTDAELYSSFTGATGSAAGTSGLVPAPTATDNTKFLKGDGTWGTVDALPSQTSQSGKFLTTNGTTASWATVDALPSQTSQSGKFLTTNGTTASWATPSIAWGDITGTLANQTDLKSALDDKVEYAMVITDYTA